MKIDVHNHAFPQSVLDLVEKEDAYGLKLVGGVVKSRYSPDEELIPALVEPRLKVADLERVGLDAAVVSVSPDLFAYETEPDAGRAMALASNQGLADFCAVVPDRLKWMANVPLQSPQLAVEVLDGAVRMGAVGVEIGTAVADRRPDEPEFEPFWSAVERHGLPVFVHPAYNRPNDGLEPFHFQNVMGNPLETTIFVERMICTRTLDRHPGVRLILSHGGGFFPYQVGRLRHARTVRVELKDAPEDPWSYVRRQIYIDTICHDRQALSYLVARAGADRVIMGTDAPFDMATPEPMRALLEAVSAADARQIAEDNPASLFGFHG
jgi:aminocarboxymuconate-semialdehyde decarboxylase